MPTRSEQQSIGQQWRLVEGEWPSIGSPNCMLVQFRAGTEWTTVGACQADGRLIIRPALVNQDSAVKEQINPNISITQASGWTTAATASFTTRLPNQLVVVSATWTASVSAVNLSTQGRILVDGTTASSAFPAFYNQASIHLAWGLNYSNVIVTPGQHTFGLQVQMVTNPGTLNMDANDFVTILVR